MRTTIEITPDQRARLHAAPDVVIDYLQGKGETAERIALDIEHAAPRT